MVRCGQGEVRRLSRRLQLLTCQDHSHFTGVDQEQRGAVQIHVVSQHTLGIVAHVHVQIPEDDSDENVREDAGQQQKLKEIRSIRYVCGTQVDKDANQATQANWKLRYFTLAHFA